MFVLFLTPGPVWVALAARALSGGFRAAWPLALGVVIGDALWPLLAILGVSWVVSSYGEILVVLRYVASLVFLVMGVLLIRHAGAAISTDSRLTRPGLWPGFLAGLLAILGNPKAILFYMGVLPGFFDLSRVGAPDIAVIVAISMAVPFAGNLVFALFVDRARRTLTSPTALRRTNRIAGGLLILVGLVIPFT
ncbi:LysE family translocator [Rhodovulum tesquicola]|uniref:LysE family translocator n=1 Tax=Rhodovulum tesquicola TaxID=540254 RepID=UPI0025B738FD|nr:LysE family translocator [Rhodovulum tesquicola]